MNTTILFKTDKKLKKKAQETAKRAGIPLSLIFNNAMRDFVERQEITVAAKPLTPTPYLARILREGEKEYAAGRYNSFDSVDALFDHLEGKIKKRK